VVLGEGRHRPRGGRQGEKDSSTTVWRRELLDGQARSYVPEVSWDDERLQLRFPVDRYYGMPSKLPFEFPKALREGSQIRLLNENGQPFGSFRIPCDRGEVRRGCEEARGSLPAGPLM
jgi:hypothetical protein